MSKEIIEIKFSVVAESFNKQSKIQKVFWLFGIFFYASVFCISFSSCTKFLDVAPPNSKISADLIFTDDITATGALAGVYLDLLNQNNFSSGTAYGIVTLAGLSADELKNMSLRPEQLQFQQNNIDAENLDLHNFWTYAYKTIYKVNGIIEGLHKSTGVTPEIKDQLKGEALFIRAFCHFYLVNSFGDVPLILTTDYTQNALATRNSKDTLYDQILADLQEAEGLMKENYVTAGKVRPNKFAATALMARVYLYKQDWARAEDKASNVILKTGLYNVPSNLNSVFLSTSVEAIWQIKVADGNRYTNEGYWFGTNFAHQYNVLNDAIIETFEPNDLRKTNWLTSKVYDGKTLYYPYKFKLQSASQSATESNEYSTVLRLAEQLLIRAEARAQQDRLTLAIADLDIIRNRAGLPLIQNTNPSINQNDLLLAIEQERKLEFLVEWGHRWFDLKRWNRANTILGPIKTGWTSSDQLYPLPGKELRNNPKLKPQNPGY